MKEIPNILTTLRIVLTPFVAYFLTIGDYGWGLLLFVAAAATDALDGIVARRLKQTTTFGQLFDPVADKILLGVTFFTIAAIGIIPWWYFNLAVGRDLILVVAGACIAPFINDPKRLAPNMVGKICTAVQMAVLVPLVVLSVPWRIEHDLLVVSAALIVISFVWYAGRFFDAVCKRFVLDLE